MNARTLYIFLIIVFVPSLAIRLYPVTSESFAHDGIVSQQAASEGIMANASDRGDTFQLRRHHPPLLSYIIIANNTLFGNDEFRARLFSILAGALTCLMVAVSISEVGNRDKAALTGGVLGGWLICLLPVNLYISRSANWDSVYSLLCLCSLFFLSAYLKDSRFRTLLWACMLAALTFLTCELGLILLPVFAVVFVLDIRRGKHRDVMLRWGWVILSALLLVVALWPAGVLKLNILRTISYRFHDSVLEERNLPWYGFFTILFDQAPIYTIVALTGMITALLLQFTNRLKSHARHVATDTFLVRVLPFAIYVLTVLLLSLKQRLVYIHHIADLFPALTVLAISAFVYASRIVAPKLRIAGTALCILAVILSGHAAFNTDADIVGPQEHAGFLGIRDFLKDHPDTRTFYYYDYAINYYLPGTDVVSEGPRSITRETLNRVKVGDFDFIICDTTTLNGEYDSADAVADALYPEFRLARTIYHRRTDEAVAWIFGRQ